MIFHVMEPTERKYISKKRPLSETERTIVRFMFIIAGFGILFSLILPFIMKK